MRIESSAVDEAVQEEASRPSEQGTTTFGTRSYVPALSARLRAVLGAAFALLAIAWTTRGAATGSTATLLVVFTFSWLASAAVSAKYTHKYPYRYYTYLFAAHGKASLIMGLLLALATWLVPPYRTASAAIWRGFGWFVLADLLVSLPRRRRRLTTTFDVSVLTSREVSAQAHTDEVGQTHRPERGAEDGLATFADISSGLDTGMLAHVRKTVPGFSETLSTVTVEARGRSKPRGHSPCDIVIGLGSVNNVLHINGFLLGCGESLKMGGYLICYYEPIESRRAEIESRYGVLFWPVYILHFIWHRAFPKIPGLLHFYFLLTGGRNRALSKAEVWGRLSFCGLRVVAEEPSGAGRWVTARHVARPISNRTPSYYPVVGLSKVGLDGEMLTTHKVRSMHPYSEFLQKQVFDDHGLSGTGKFKNDFRLTEYGKFLRRYWLDELPQLYDWLHGDIKLVGMRATSPHFLSLYPREFIELYVRVKPGLIPPLFDERTGGFEDIVKTEFTYLKRYAHAPIRTDLLYLWTTFRDIFFRGVRSK